ncbi:MAG: hypothetical protein GDA36_09005 [Rhodobacteraceae bacterium]|nr:hypothetical protein [Paracoccaceae bacterium]
MRLRYAPLDKQGFNAMNDAVGKRANGRIPVGFSISGHSVDQQVPFMRLCRVVLGQQCQISGQHHPMGTDGHRPNFRFAPALQLYTPFLWLHPQYIAGKLRL